MKKIKKLLFEADNKTIEVDKAYNIPRIGDWVQHKENKGRVTDVHFLSDDKSQAIIIVIN